MGICPEPGIENTENRHRQFFCCGIKPDALRHKNKQRKGPTPYAFSIAQQNRQNKFSIRNELPRDSVLTLLNFPSHILPGTATIHRGEFISGCSGLAGMTGFFPFDFDREELLRRLNPRECLPVIVKSTAALISIVNPGTMVFTGDLMSQKLTEQVYQQCLQYIPPEHMPRMIFREDIEEYYRWGMYQRALELNLEENLRTKEF